MIRHKKQISMDQKIKVQTDENSQKIEYKPTLISMVKEVLNYLMPDLLLQQNHKLLTDNHGTVWLFLNHELEENKLKFYSYIQHFEERLTTPAYWIGFLPRQEYNYFVYPPEIVSNLPNLKQYPYAFIFSCGERMPSAKDKNAKVVSVDPREIFWQGNFSYDGLSCIKYSIVKFFSHNIDLKQKPLQKIIPNKLPLGHRVYYSITEQGYQPTGLEFSIEQNKYYLYLQTINNLQRLFGGEYEPLMKHLRGRVFTLWILDGERIEISTDLKCDNDYSVRKQGPASLSWKIKRKKMEETLLSKVDIRFLLPNEIKMIYRP